MGESGRQHPTCQCADDRETRWNQRLATWLRKHSFLITHSYITQCFLGHCGSKTTQQRPLEHLQRSDGGKSQARSIQELQAGRSFSSRHQTASCLGNSFCSATPGLSQLERCSGSSVHSSRLSTTSAPLGRLLQRSLLSFSKSPLTFPSEISLKETIENRGCGARNHRALGADAQARNERSWQSRDPAQQLQKLISLREGSQQETQGKGQKPQLC